MKSVGNNYCIYILYYMNEPNKLDNVIFSIKTYKSTS